MRFLIFFLLLIPSISNAKFSTLSCSKSGTHIFAINGVGIDETKFNKFSSDSENLFLGLQKRFLDLSSSAISFSAHHNHSFQKYYDAYEAWLLNMQESNKRRKKAISFDMIRKLYVYAITPNYSKLNLACATLGIELDCKKLYEILFFQETRDDLDKMKNEVLNQIIMNKKIIFLTHSAGAMFADRIRDWIKTEWPKHYKFTSHLALARPLPTKHDNSYYLTFSDDELTEKLRGLDILLNVPPANVWKTESCLKFTDDKKDEYINHDYGLCYLQTSSAMSFIFPDTNQPTSSKEYVANALYRVASYLANNDEETCCSSSRKGKVWINSDNSIGGFVSNDIEVSGNPYISKDSQLCGKGKIHSRDSMDRIRNQSKILGEIDLKYPFDLSKVNTTKNSKVSTSDLTTSANSTLYLEDVTITGSSSFTLVPNIYGSGYLHVGISSLTGTNEIKGGWISLTNSELYSSKITGANRKLTLDKVKNQKGYSVNIEAEQGGTLDNRVDNVQADKAINIKGENIDVRNVISTENIFLSAKKINFLNTNANNISAKCDNYINASVNMPNKILDISECEEVVLSFSSTDNVMLKGSSQISGSYNGINSSVGKELSKGMFISGKVTGTTYINAPDGISGGTITVFGNLSYFSTCGKRVGMLWQMASWNGDFSHSFTTNSNHTCFDYNGSGLCYDNGTACISF